MLIHGFHFTTAKTKNLEKDQRQGKRKKKVSYHIALNSYFCSLASRPIVTDPPNTACLPGKYLFSHLLQKIFFFFFLAKDRRIDANEK